MGLGLGERGEARGRVRLVAGKARLLRLERRVHVLPPEPLLRPAVALEAEVAPLRHRRRRAARDVARCALAAREGVVLELLQEPLLGLPLDVRIVAGDAVQRKTD